MIVGYVNTVLCRVTLYFIQYFSNFYPSKVDLFQNIMEASETHKFECIHSIVRYKHKIKTCVYGFFFTLRLFFRITDDPEKTEKIAIDEGKKRKCGFHSETMSYNFFYDIRASE